MGPSRTAIHEAGHAVTAAHFGWTGLRIELTGGAENGRFYFAPPRLAGLTEPWRSADAVACCQVAVAGAVAGTRATRGQGWERWLSDPDAAALRDGLAVLGVDAPTFPLAVVAAHEHVAAVRRLMRRLAVWPTVLRLAAALEHENSIDLDDRPDLLVGLPLASA